MATLREIINERKEGIVEIRKALRDVDTQIEKTQRIIQRILNRKKAVPESQDLATIVSGIRLIDQALDSATAVAETAGRIFGI